MTRTDAHPVELAALAVLALGCALMTVARLLVPALALLLVALGWRPAPRPAGPRPVPVASAPIAASEARAPGRCPRAGLRQNSQVATPAPPLGRLSVADVRRLARAVGLPRPLSRSGRRVQLLEALVAS